MNQLEAFDICTVEQARKALEKAWDNGACRSCGWHSAFYEVIEDLEPVDESLVEWHTYCHAKYKDEGEYCRGCDIYPDFVKELEGE